MEHIFMAHVNYAKVSILVLWPITNASGYHLFEWENTGELLLMHWLSLWVHVPAGLLFGTLLSPVFFLGFITTRATEFLGIYDFNVWQELSNS